MSIDSQNNIDNAELEAFIESEVATPSTNAAVWYTGNLPAGGNTSQISTRVVSGSSLANGPGDVISASDIVAAIQTRAEDASRIRLAHFYKQSSGGAPWTNGCSYGDYGTQVTALNTNYLRYNVDRTTAGIESNGNILAGEDVDTGPGGLDDAIGKAAASLVADRTADVVQFGTCHCSCHSNDSGRNRR